MSEINFNDYFYYDETSPSCLRWKYDRRAGKDHNMILVYSGEKAGSFCKLNGYWGIHLYRKKYMTHRVIWTLHYGEVPIGMDVDHVDRVKTNNRISNLRLVSEAVNSRNCPMFKNNKSGKTGVCRRNGAHSGWRATWRLLTGERRDKYFSDKMYGDDGFRLACEYRDKMIANLNEQGAGYSEGHGTALAANTQE